MNRRKDIHPPVVSLGVVVGPGGRVALRTAPPVRLCVRCPSVDARDTLRVCEDCLTFAVCARGFRYKGARFRGRSFRHAGTCADSPSSSIAALALRGRRRRGAAAERSRGADELHAGAAAASARSASSSSTSPKASFLGTVAWLRDPRAHASANFVVAPRRPGAGARAAARHRLARRQLGVQRPLGRDRERRLTPTIRPASRLPEYRATRAARRGVARRSLIPIDRQHIIGHYQVPDPNDPLQGGGIDRHTDPGAVLEVELLHEPRPSASPIRRAA